MKMTTAYALAWVSTASAVIVAVAVTGRLTPMWALLLPAMISFSSKSEEEN